MEREGQEELRQWCDRGLCFKNHNWRAVSLFPCLFSQMNYMIDHDTGSINASWAQFG